MQSFKKKIVSLINNGTDPIEEGIRNFNNPVLEIERLAESRKDECIVCDFYVDEPIKFLRVEDKNIVELSNKMCDECGCTLSYKTRQSITKCKKWQE